MTTDPDFVAKFVTLQPDLEHLSNVANPLLLTLLDVPHGLEYLLEQEYLEDEFDYWFEVFAVDVAWVHESNKAYSSTRHWSSSSSRTPKTAACSLHFNPVNAKTSSRRTFTAISHAQTKDARFLKRRGIWMCLWVYSKRSRSRKTPTRG
jgi:Rapamycin-insensitive companion of mTOR RasGEF_N domain